MVRILGLIGFFTLGHLAAAKDAVVVFVVVPSWDCVESYVANVPLFQEYKIVKVMTHPAPQGNIACSYTDRWPIYKQIAYNSFTPNDELAAEEIYPQLKALGMPIAAVIPTYDPAIYLADRLSARLGTRANPFEGPLAHARFDKWAMSEAVRKAGLRSVKERKVSTWADAKAYLESLNPPLSNDNPVIFKVLQGSSSRGVHKVYSMEQADLIFHADVGTKTQFGDRVMELIIQECFKQGQEYVIDSASRDGIHKISMVWHEDIRDGVAGFNTYYGFQVMDPEDPKTKKIIDYANKVLTATGVQNGASDMEVFWIEEEQQPCVTDLNARWTALMWHDGLAIEEATYGDNQISMVAAAYLDGDAFDKYPLVPKLSQFGALVFCYAVDQGTLTGIPGLDIAKKLPSYAGVRNRFAHVGQRIDHSNLKNSPLVVLLTNKEKAVIDEDYDYIIKVEYSHKFYKVKPFAEYTLLSSQSGEDIFLGSPVAAFASSALLIAAAALALGALWRRNIKDGTEYVSIDVE